MLRLAKYLKPFTLLVLGAILLLFVQAVSDLSLPDYMSKIVNVGIQQSGVDTAVPSAIRKSEMDKVFIFLSADNQKRVLDDYTLVDKNSPDYGKYVAQYSTLANEPVYVLKSLDAAEHESMSTIMGRSMFMVYTIEQIAADPSKAAALGQGGNMSSITALPKGADPFATLKSLPPLVLNGIVAGINKKLDGMGTTMLIQSAAAAVKAEYVALGVDATTMQTNYILHIGIIMLLISLLSGVCTVLVGLLSARTAAGLARNLRRFVFRKVESFSNTEFDKFSTASLITRSTNDITQIQMVVMIIIRMACYAPIMGVGGVIMALGKSTSMSWIIALAVVILMGVIMVVFSTTLPKFRVIQNLIDRLNRVSRENLSGMMVIRAFNTQDFELKRFDKANQDLTGTSLFVNRVMVAMMPIMMLIMNGVSLMIIWVGAHQVAQSSMQVGDMMAFMQYAMQIVMSFLFLSFLFIILPRASVSAARIADVLETETTINDPDKPKPFKAPFNGKVEFRNVNFRYPHAEEDALHNISFTALPGQTTAIIGSTGAGKSTLINLIPRFYDVTGGSILLDEMDIREVTQSDLRDKIGYIPQKAMLFSGTIDSNLRYADENATPEMLQEATDIAQASGFINEKPEGLATEISQGGTNVSGGQRQRLSIARALVKKPPIYIFDDSFSAVDFKTDVALRRALKEHTGSSTVLIVAQRISTIKNAELIIVLDEGKIVGKGTHSELMENCETYREIALSQLSMEELA